MLPANGPKKPPPATSAAQVSPAATAVTVAVLDFMLSVATDVSDTAVGGDACPSQQSTLRLGVEHV